VTTKRRTIRIERHGATEIVVLDRPERKNAFDAQMRGELKAAWRDTAADAMIKCVVITGAGEAFCAGADLGDLAEGVRVPAGTNAAAVLDFLPTSHVEVPVIVAVNGVCAGGGLAFVADADIVVASRRASFTDPHLDYGQVSALEPLMLMRKTGAGLATYLTLQGKSFRLKPADARDAGLVQDVVDDNLLMDRALALADAITAKSPAAVRRSVALLRAARSSGLGADLDAAWSSAMSHWNHPDATEGARAFLDHRAPKWVDPE
jgi:enoyl-CoA hydratase/carnithine racemase